MSRKNILIALAVVIVGAGIVGANLYFKRDKGVTVTTETIKARDLEAIVSASGKIQPKRLVNITAETSGRVVNLAVNEGDRIHAGQFLLQIDPKSLRSRVDNSEASLQVASASLEQMRQAVETARVQLEQARQTLTRQQGLWKQQLTTRAELERAENDVKAAESALQEREKQQAGTLFGMFNMFVGGALEKASVFSLGVMPYISASIILQLLTVVVPTPVSSQRNDPKAATITSARPGVGRSGKKSGRPSRNRRKRAGRFGSRSNGTSVDVAEPLVGEGGERLRADEPPLRVVDGLPVTFEGQALVARLLPGGFRRLVHS